MRRRVAILVAAACAGVAGADWPQFRGPDRDGIVRGQGLPAEWPAELKARWEVPLGEGFSSPVVAGRQVFTLAQDGPNEVVEARDAATGRSLWRHAYPARYRSGLAGNGPRATPAVDGDRLYSIGATGEMVCLKTADGALVWRLSFSEAFRFRTPIYGLSPSPLVDGERVIVHTGARDGRSIVAIDKHTGKIVWASQSDPAGYASPMFVPASETRGPRQLIVFTEDGLVSLNPANGAFYWRFPWTTSYEQNIAQPMLDGDLLIVTSLTGTAALSLAQERGKPVFREAWTQDDLTVHFSCPVAFEGHLYGAFGRRPVLRCMNVRDGTVKWSRDLPARQRAGVVLAVPPATSPPAATRPAEPAGGAAGLSEAVATAKPVAAAQLIVYTDRGNLVVADATPAGYRERASYQAAGPNWVPPVLAQGGLFLRDNSSLRCFPLP